MNALLQRLGISLPIIQAPMAGVSTPAMAAAVSNAGALGSVSVGASTPQAAQQTIRATRAATDNPFNVNVFCHRPAAANSDKEAKWLQTLAPLFARFGAAPPDHLTEIYKSFLDDSAMLEVLLAERPRVVSFHFGLPRREHYIFLKQAEIFLMASATNLEEARAAQELGIDAVIAQGYEAGGHRGTFSPDAPDTCLGTLALTRLLVKNLQIPVISAGGIMDGAGIAASLALGASAVQMGTAFIACTESAADPAHQELLLSAKAQHTVMTKVISGRMARGIANEFTDLGKNIPDAAIPDYPIAYDAGKALHQAAKAKGHNSFGAHWAGQGAPLARRMPAAQLIACIHEELIQSQRQSQKQ